VPRSLEAVASIAAICVLALTSAGVSAAPSSRVTTRASVHRPSVTVYVWDQFSNAKRDREREALRAVVSSWERRTGNKVHLLGNPGASSFNLCSLGPAGKAPDLIAMPHEQLGTLRECSAIRPIPASAWPLSKQRQYIGAATLAPRIGGQEWAMPWAVSMPVLYYNRSLVPPGFFSKGAVTWTSVINLAKRLTNRKSGTYGLAWDPTSFYFDYGFISGAGGYVFKAGSGGFNSHQLGVDSRETISGLRFLRDLTTTGRYGLVRPNMSDPVAQGLFANGKAAMYLGGSSSAQYFGAFMRIRRTYTFGTAPPLLIGRRVSRPLADVQVFVLNRYSGHPKAALSLLSYMTSHMQLAEYRAAGWMPVLHQDLSSSAILKNPQARGLALEAPYADAVPNILQMNLVWGPMNQAVSAVVTGRESPTRAARRASIQIRASIGRLGG
jgi:arabinogalactan oligomer / maltooligosaccharide transport system substrate-binding protein